MTTRIAQVMLISAAALLKFEDIQTNLVRKSDEKVCFLNAECRALRVFWVIHHFSGLIGPLA